MKLTKEQYTRQVRINAQIINEELLSLSLLTYKMSSEYKDFWEKAEDVKSQLKNIHPLIAEDKERFWKTYKEKCNEVYFRQSKYNVSIIEDALDDLVYKDLFSRYSAYDFKNFWKQAKKISALFKTLKPIAKEERERLWSNYNSKCQEAKKRQNEVHESLVYASNYKKELVISTLNHTLSKAKRLDFETAFIWLRHALEYLKNGWTDEFEGFLRSCVELNQLTGDVLHDGRMLKKDKDYCWQRWKEVNNELHQLRRDYNSRTNYSIARNELDLINESAAYGDPYEAISKIKNFQKNLKEMKMNSEHWAKTQEYVNVLWNISIERANKEKEKKQREWHKKQDEWHKKQDEWRDKMINAKGKMERIINNNENYIGKIKNEILELEEKRDTAWSDNFRTKVEEWIEEKQEKIEEIIGNNYDIQAKIDDIQEKLL